MLRTSPRPRFRAGWHGPILGPTTMSALLSINVDALSPEAALDYAVELQRHSAHLAALEARALARAAGATQVVRDVLVIDDDDTERHLTMVDEVREEISAALNRHPATVHTQVDHARLLTGPLRGTLTALQRGDITPAHARVVCEQAARMQGLRDHDDPALAELCLVLESRLLPHARHESPGRLRTRARRAVARIDAEGERRRREAGRACVDVRVQALDDGLALLQAWLPTVDALRIQAAVDAHAATGALDTPCDASIGQRRGAALVDLVLGVDDPAAAGRPAVTAEVSVVVDLPTLLALQQSDSTCTESLRVLLDDPRCPVSLRRLVVDPITGHLLDRGRTRYQVTEELRAFLIARDGTCRFPGCSRRAVSCQVDHAQAWEDGGPSDRANTGPLCLRHHQSKTHGGWRILESLEDGSCTWRSPRGRVYHHDPPDLRPF